MHFQNLSDTSIELLTQVFNTAFAGYYVPINFTEEGMRFRIRRGRIDLALSVGAFQEAELVGFMLSGADHWQGQHTIYNAGTGVIPAFRGQQLVDQMYDWAMPLWRKADYTQATLEVMVENARAIKAYERVGMRIDRKLLSRSGPPAVDLSTTTVAQGYLLEEVATPNWPVYHSLLSFEPSWDFCQAGVAAVKDSCRFFELRPTSSDTVIGFAIVNSNDQIAQAGIHKDLKVGWAVLINALHAFYPELKWINIDEKAHQLLASLQQQSWTTIIDQYEMKMKI